MTPLRRFTGAALLIALAALVAFALVSCGKNELMGQGLERTILVKGASPKGHRTDPDPDSTYKWAVNSIDSVVFTDDIDSTTLAVTSFQLTDSTGHLVAGTIRFMPSNAYIQYRYMADPAVAYMDSSYEFLVSPPPMAKTIGKVYFIPNRPLARHSLYIYTLSTGIRMTNGHLKRDLQTFSFYTGDTLPPVPAFIEQR